MTTTYDSSVSPVLSWSLFPGEDSHCPHSPPGELSSRDTWCPFHPANPTAPEKHSEHRSCKGRTALSVPLPPGCLPTLMQISKALNQGVQGRGASYSPLRPITLYSRATGACCFGAASGSQGRAGSPVKLLSEHSVIPSPLAALPTALVCYVEFAP